MSGLQLQRTRRNRLHRAKLRAAANRRMKLQPTAASWFEIHNLYEKWREDCDAVSKNISICSSCGVTRFSKQRDAKPSTTRIEIPLACATLLCAAENNNIATHWFTCTSCERVPRTSSIVVLQHDYTRRVLNGNQLHTQLLSLLDASVTVTSSANAVARGLLDRRSLLDNPLICWTDSNSLARLSSDIKNSELAAILAHNIKNNPFVKKYKTITEQPHKKTSVCILSSEAVSQIMHDYTENGPFELMNEASAHLDLGILQNMYTISNKRAYNTTDTHEFGSVQLRDTSKLVERTISFQNNGMPASTSETKDLTIEAAMFPFLFPLGTGHYKGGNRLSDYIKMRISTLFSVYTLYKPYLLMMYQVKQAIMIANSVNSTLLQRDIDAFKKSKKGASNADAIRSVIRHNLPSSMPGSPPWHRKNLRDLISMVETWGLPDLFLTFTADEVTETRWEEIVTIESLGHAFNNNFTWKDCPVECAVLFHTRLHNFLNSHIFAASKVLGNVQHYLIRYEIQNRGSLHAHIILWVSKEDIDATSRKIAAYIPIPSSESDTYTEKLKNLVQSKQLHKCRPSCRATGRGTTCKYGFPFSPHFNTSPTLDPQTLRWLYYRPGDEHRNVVPYHPTLLMLWGAHMNIQRVTNSSISHYLLKYALKTEPMGRLNLSPSDATRLGLHGLDKTKLSLIAATVLSKPISATEAGLNCLQVPIITRSEPVEYVDSSPPSLRQRIVSRSQTIVMHPIDLYCARPIELDDCSFYNYHKRYRVQKHAQNPRQHDHEMKDAFNNTVIESPHLVRFTEYHPGHQTEGFFFNLLLRTVPFRNEPEIISPENTVGSYFEECKIRQLIENEEHLEMYVDEYTQRNMLTNETTGHILNLLQQKLVLARETPLDITVGDNSRQAQQWLDRRLQILKDFAIVGGISLTQEQQGIFDKIFASQHGLHIISGVPGCGKSFLIKYLTSQFIHQNRNVVLTASTGAAAARLSRFASTVHYQFKISNGTNLLYPSSIEPTDERYLTIHQSNVIIIDEMSMLTSMTFDIVVRQIVNITNGSLHNPFVHKLVLLFGDLAQLPPVCKHQGMTCQVCSIARSSHIKNATHHRMSVSVRHASDPAFLQFLHTIRQRRPTSEEIKNTLAECIIDENQMMDTMDDRTTIICTHREDVLRYNNMMLDKLFTQQNIIRVTLKTNAKTEEALTKWLDDTTFNEIGRIALGAKCMITSNIDTTIGAANGATCTVQEITYDADGGVKAIKVEIDATLTPLIIRRTKHARRSIDGNWYHKSTFPLTLAYAITGHKSQGATIPGKAVLKIKEAFSAGLIYVMLSRVTDRRNLKIINIPTPDMFDPNIDPFTSQ